MNQTDWALIGPTFAIGSRMRRISSSTGATVSFERYGSGPPLVLVHGSFSDHHTNWECVKPQLAKRFAVHAVARRGRGETDASESHTLEDESMDVVALIRSIGEPVFLLGHSYGAQVALAVASTIPEHVRKLVLYEAPWPHIVSTQTWAQLEKLAESGDWEQFAVTFFRDALFVPVKELDGLRTTELWSPIVADARASLHDLRALNRYDFRPERFRELRIPVILQIGTESLRELYITDALATVLPDVRVGELPGQAHEGMTTAPDVYAKAVSRFLLG